MVDSRTKDIFFFTIIAICLIAIACLVIYMRNEDMKCLKNPFIYGASKMKHIDCSCIQTINQLCPAKFYFNDTTFDAQVTRCGTEKPQELNETQITELLAGASK